MLKWTLRILFALVCLIGLGLFLVSLISGTGDSQKKGLEGAFSQIFQGKAHIGQLNSFNIMPQFDVDVSDLTIAIQTGGNINAKHIRAAFGVKDLFFQTRHIEDLSIENLIVDKDVWGTVPITLTQVSLKKTDSPGHAQMLIDGLINTQKIHATMDMQSFDTPRPSFGFNSSNPFTILSGTITTTGNLIPSTPDMKSFSHIRVQGFGAECALPEDMAVDGVYFFNTILVPQAALKNKSGVENYCSKIRSDLAKPASK